jgi:hypothetical protein
VSNDVFGVGKVKLTTTNPVYSAELRRAEIVA